MIHSGFLLLLLLHGSCSGLDVLAPITHDALIGSTTLLPCSFTVDSPPINPQFLAILWYYGEKELIRHDNKEKFSITRMSIDGQEARQGNASLTIQNMTIADQGNYKCVIIYSPSTKSKEIRLNIQAIPLVTLLKKAVSKNKKNRLLCMVTDFYPRDIAVTWLRNGQKLDGAEFGEFQCYADGTYRVNSSITISPAQIQDHPTITCQVKHVSLQEPIQDGFTVQYGVEPKLSLFSSHHDGEQIYVCEVKEFYPDSVDIAWLLDGKRVQSPKRNMDGSFNTWERFLIPGNQKRPDDISCVVGHETLYSPLVVTQAVKVLDVKDSQTSGVTTAILVTMFIALGAFSAVLWFLVYKRKYFQRLQLSPIHVSDIRSGGTEYKVSMYCMANNCREEVVVTWTVMENGGQKVTIFAHQMESDGESGQLMSSDYLAKIDQSQQPDGLYHAITSLNFTPTAPKHLNMKITCCFQCGKNKKETSITWIPKKEWMSQEREEIRRMPEGTEQDSADGNLEAPCSSVVMEDIKIPQLVHGRQARLQCVIRAPFPGNLEVKWLRRAAEDHEMYEVSSNNIYRIPAMESIQEAEKTYLHITSLIISVSAKEEEGSEFICRVMHPSLQKYLEKRTDQLMVAGKPMVRRVQQDDSSIILEVGGFYTTDLRVTWHRGDNEAGSYDTISKECIQKKTTENSDGSYTLTSTCKAMGFVDHLTRKDIYFKAIMDHGSLKSPVEIIFKRSGGKYYRKRKEDYVPLEQGSWNTVMSAASTNDQRSAEAGNAKGGKTGGGAQSPRKDTAQENATSSRENNMSRVTGKV